MWRRLTVETKAEGPFQATRPPIWTLSSKGGASPSRRAADAVTCPNSQSLGHRGSPGRTRHGFTLIEILVVIAIITILAMLLLPALSATKIKGKQIACLNNLKQLAFAVQMY